MIFECKWSSESWWWKIKQFFLKYKKFYLILHFAHCTKNYVFEKIFPSLKLISFYHDHHHSPDENVATLKVHCEPHRNLFADSCDIGNNLIALQTCDCVLLESIVATFVSLLLSQTRVQQYDEKMYLGDFWERSNLNLISSAHLEIFFLLYLHHRYYH